MSAQTTQKRTADQSPAEWKGFPAAGIELGHNGKVYMVKQADFAKLVAWLLGEDCPNRSAIISNEAKGDQRVSEAWNVAREWAGDIATRYHINTRFGELADFLGFDF